MSKISKFDLFLYEQEEEQSQTPSDDFHAKHKGGFTSDQVNQIRQKEGIKFNPDAGHPTQRSNTTASYERFYHSAIAHFKDIKDEGDLLGLDYSAGLGMGSAMLRKTHNANIESYEPFPHARAVDITHKGISSLPNKKYDYIINSAVLNVIEQDIRDHVVKDIYAHLKPGGVAIIGVRSKADVMGTKTALVLSKENGEILDRTRGSYQKGFTSGELSSYIQQLLPDASVVIVGGMSQVCIKVFKPEVDWNANHPSVDADIPKKDHPIMKYLK